tara:strand:- start:69 stop:446 length:378 start_codon:yes stop_codon:yes gene_type:complete
MNTLNEEISRTKELMGVGILNENIGQEMLASISEELPEATRADYDRFLACLENYNIDPDILSNGNVFVNVQLHTLGMDSTNPAYYNMRIGLMSHNMNVNKIDVYNRVSDEPSTCAMDIINEFMPS